MSDGNARKLVHTLTYDLCFIKADGEPEILTRFTKLVSEYL